MFLQSKDGILCDFCGMIYKNDFLYYATKAVELKIINCMKISHKDANFDKDMCHKCYDTFINDITKNLGQHKKNYIKCDLSDQYKTGDFDYWIINFDKIEVNYDNVPPVSVQRQVMDINLLDFKKITSKIKENNNGAWS